MVFIVKIPRISIQQNLRAWELYLNGAFDQRAWSDEIDLLRYKTVIRNGIIEEIDDKYLNDLQLGVLTKTELKLLRNFFMLKKGIFFRTKN